MLKFLTAVLVLLVWSPLHAEGQAKEQGGPIPFRKLEGKLDKPQEIASWRAGCLAKENCEGDAYQLLDGGILVTYVIEKGPLTEQARTHLTLFSAQIRSVER